MPTGLQVNTTHVSDLKGHMEQRSSPITDTKGPQILSGTGQVFLHTGLKQVQIHTGSGAWRQIQLTTTSTSTS